MGGGGAAEFTEKNVEKFQAWERNEGGRGGVTQHAAAAEEIAQTLHAHALKGAAAETVTGKGLAAGRPVEGVGGGQTPVDGTVEGIEFAHEIEVHAEGGFEGGALVGGQGVKVEEGSAEDVLDAFGEAAFVGVVGLIHLHADFVLVHPADVPMEGGGGRVVAEAFVAEEVDAVVDPAPAVLGVREKHGDIVGEVPGLEGPDFGNVGFELADPGGELNEFEELPVVLEFVGAHPEGVGHQAAETAEGNGGDGDEGGCVLGRNHLKVISFSGRNQTRVLRPGDEEKEEGEEEGEEEDLFHSAPPVSRRWKRRIPLKEITRRTGLKRRARARAVSAGETRMPRATRSSGPASSRGRSRKRSVR